MVSIPPSLLAPSLTPFWSAVVSRLERRGIDDRGRLRVPPLDTAARLALQSLLAAPLRSMVSLADLERSLVERSIGHDLRSALDALGHSVDEEPARRRAHQRERSATIDLARQLAAEWDEPWVSQWIDGVVRRGLLRDLGPEEALLMVRSSRTVIEQLLPGDLGVDIRSRTDLAAQVLGSSHALDSGSRLEAAVSLALRLMSSGTELDEDHHDVWERFGVMTDHVSSPALTWGLRLLDTSALAPLARQAHELGIVIHLSRDAIRRYPITVEPGTIVLVTENPRVVEAAAQRRTPFAVVTTNGNPTSAVQLMVRQLLESGARLRYHGDFDSPGLAICARMYALGLEPWRMGEFDYRRAAEAAEADGVALPAETRRCGATPWDPPLAAAVRELGVIVHEERLLDDLLDSVSVNE